MKLIKTIKGMPPLKIVTPKKEAARLMQRGIEQDLIFDRSAKALKQAAMEAGFYFLRAKAAFEHGEWQVFVEQYSDKIALRTVQSHMLNATLQAAWVRYKNPDVKDLDEIKRLAIEEVMISPLGLVALMREKKQMLHFGGYFADDYEIKKKKLGNGQQQEFAFDVIMKPLEVLLHFGEEGYEFTYPEGRDSVEFMTEVESKLEAALARVRQVKQHGRIIDL